MRKLYKRTASRLDLLDGAEMKRKPATPIASMDCFSKYFSILLSRLLLFSDNSHIHRGDNAAVELAARLQNMLILVAESSASLHK